MAYFQGFLVPVPGVKKAAYEKMARDAVPLFSDYGARRIVECWERDVPHGESTDMFRAVKAEEDEKLVFSWIDWESKAACDRAHDEMMNDERMQSPPEDMPFDGMRMTYAGFEVLGETGTGGIPAYVQGYIAPVPKENRSAFAKMCETMRTVAVDCGALRATDGWADRIDDGKVTDFKQAVKAGDDEAIAFGYVEWASKKAFDHGSEKMRADDRMPPPGSDMPLDGKRLIYGGFEVILDTKEMES